MYVPAGTLVHPPVTPSTYMVQCGIRGAPTGKGTVLGAFGTGEMYTGRESRNMYTGREDYMYTGRGEYMYTGGEEHVHGQES